MQSELCDNSAQNSEDKLFRWNDSAEVLQTGMSRIKWPPRIIRTLRNGRHDSEMGSGNSLFHH